MQLHKDTVLDATVREPGMAYRQMLASYMRWLQAIDETWPDTEKVMNDVTLHSFWLTSKWAGGWSTDAPSLRLDALTDPESRLVVICCTPFHDEGGAAELTAWFDAAVKESWMLRDMVMQFDTERNMIVRNGKLVGTGGL